MTAPTVRRDAFGRAPRLNHAGALGPARFPAVLGFDGRGPSLRKVAFGARDLWITAYSERDEKEDAFTCIRRGAMPMTSLSVGRDDLDLALRRMGALPTKPERAA